MIPTKATAIGIIMAVVAGAFLSCAAAPSADAATTEREWWPLDTNITVDKSVSGSGTTKYVQIEEGEILTVNWLALNMTSQEWITICLYPNIPPLNWSNMTEGATCQITWNYHLSPPQTSWLRSGGHDVMKVNLFAGEAYGGTWTSVIINMTVTRDNYTAPSIESLEDEIAALQEQIDAIDISSLQQAISDLQAAQTSLNTQITSLRDLITALQAVVAQNGQNDAENMAELEGQITNLSDALKVLEHVGALNDAILEAEITLLTEKIANVNSTATNTTITIDNSTYIESDYNDSALWSKVNELEAAPPIVQVYNNTTQVHPATIVYQNRTTTQKEDAGAGIGLLAGFVSVLVAVIIVEWIIFVRVVRKGGS